MRIKERGRGRMSYGGGRRSPYHGYSPSRSPRYRSPSPREGRYSRSNDGSSRRERYESISPPARGRSRVSRSPDTHRKGRDHSPADVLDSSPAKDGQIKIDGHKKRGRRSASAEKSYSPRSKDGQANKSPGKQQSKFRSVSPLPPSQAYSRSPGGDSRSRSKSWRESRSPSSRSPPPRRQRHASSSRSPRSRSPPPRRQRHAPSSMHANSRSLPDPAQKTYSSLTPEERSPHGESQSPGPSR